MYNLIIRVCIVLTAADCVGILGLTVGVFPDDLDWPSKTDGDLQAWFLVC